MLWISFWNFQNNGSFVYADFDRKNRFLIESSDFWVEIIKIFEFWRLNFAIWRKIPFAYNKIEKICCHSYICVI